MIIIGKLTAPSPGSTQAIAARDEAFIRDLAVNSSAGAHYIDICENFARSGRGYTFMVNGYCGEAVDTPIVMTAPTLKRLRKSLSLPKSPAL